MILRIVIAVAAIGAMSLTAFAQSPDLAPATGITQDQLNAACGDAELPKGLALPACKSQ